MSGLRDRENTRVRDLADLVILIEHGLLDPLRVAVASSQVWEERDAKAPPMELPPPPRWWPDRYERLAADHGLRARSCDAAIDLVDRLWADMFPVHRP